MVIFALIGAVFTVGMILIRFSSPGAPPAAQSPTPTPAVQSAPATPRRVTREQVSPPESAVPHVDAGTWLACRDFAPLARDVDAGLLTAAEFRTGMREVYDHAQTQPSSEVAVQSRELLRLFSTGGSDAEARTAMVALIRACTPLLRVKAADVK